MVCSLMMMMMVRMARMPVKIEASTELSALRLDAAIGPEGSAGQVLVVEYAHLE